MDREAWSAGVHRVTKSWTRLSDWTELVCYSFSSKEQASFNFIYSDFGAQENKSVTISIVSPSVCHEVMGLDAMILVFWILSFKPAFSCSSFTLIKRFFSSSSLSAIRMVSSTYLRLLIFLPAILTPTCASSSLPFHMMYYAFKTVIVFNGSS